MKLKIAVNGACGRMGRTVGRLVFASNDLTLAAALEHAGHPAIGKDYGTLLGLDRRDVTVTSRLERKADALIDFSTPEATLKRLAECVATKTPMVICTTGLAANHMAVIRKASRKIPCLVSSNMSVGVNVLFTIAPLVIRALGEDYDIEIVETHHNRKKDAPSGTALTLAEKCAAARGWKPGQVFVYGRRGNAPRKRNEIGIHAVRSGNVVGEHQLLLASQGDTIEITHRAQTRDIFAAGALRAARFLSKARPGLYSMADVLGRDNP